MSVLFCYDAGEKLGCLVILFETHLQGMETISFAVSRVGAASPPQHYVFVHHVLYLCAIFLIVAALLDNGGVDPCYMRWSGDAVICGSRDSRGWYWM